MDFLFLIIKNANMIFVNIINFQRQQFINEYKKTRDNYKWGRGPGGRGGGDLHILIQKLTN